MDSYDIPYLLKRAHAHRLLAAAANCSEVNCVHRNFVKSYQRVLAEIRRDQLHERRIHSSPLFRGAASDKRVQDATAVSSRLERPILYIGQNRRIMQSAYHQAEGRLIGA